MGRGLPHEKKHKTARKFERVNRLNTKHNKLESTVKITAISAENNTGKILTMENDLLNINNRSDASVQGVDAKLKYLKRKYDELEKNMVNMVKYDELEIYESGKVCFRQRRNSRKYLCNIDLCK